MTLALRDIGKTVGSACHLDGITLDLAPGSLNVLLGRTTAGKTSLMRLMAGLDRPTTGQVLVDGVDVTGVAPQKRSVAMVYQQFINYPSLSVYDNIAAPLRRQGKGKAAIDAKVRSVAALVHIDHLLDRLPAELSGGQQQRCAIARALAKEARLLLLDEPLVNLDYKLREELREELGLLFRRSDAIVVYATTEPQEALVMGGRTIVLDEGRILQSGPSTSVFHHPASLRVAEVFSDPPLNLASAVVEEDSLTVAGDVRLPRVGHLARLDVGPCRIGLRASHLFLRRPGAATFEAEVELAEISGSETFVHIRRPGLNWVVQCEGVEHVELGQRISVGLDPERVFVFGQDGALRAAPAAALEA